MTLRARWAEGRLRYSFRNHSLLETALTHRSAANVHNERMEFLGDAFLSFYIAESLYRQQPDATEGDLSRLRAALVKRPTLAEIGRELGIEDQLILGPGEIRSGGASRDTAIADALEALIGAVLLDGGPDAAARLLDSLYAGRLASLPDANVLKDPKTRLQEWLQARALPLPVYQVQRVHGREHEQTFTVTCRIGERNERTEGAGRSRRAAEQAAAEAMLSVLSRDSIN